MRTKITAIIFLLAVCSIHTLYAQEDSTKLRMNKWKMYAGDNINPKIKNEITPIKNVIIYGLLNNKPDTIKQYLADTLLETVGTNWLYQMSHMINENVTSKKFNVIDEFHVSNTQGNSINNISWESDLTGKYNLQYLALNKEMYVVLGYFEDQLYEANLIMIFGKYNDEWRINILKLGRFRICSKNAIDWFNEAKEDYSNGHLVDAMNKLYFVQQLVKPLESLFSYANEQEIKEFFETAIPDINSKITAPIYLNEVSTKPQLLKINPLSTLEFGYVPQVIYISGIENFDDSLKVALECDEVNEKIDNTFKGLTKNKKAVEYLIYKQMPKSIEEKHYKFTKRIQ